MRSTFTEDGKEIPDPTPVSVPAGWQRPPTLHEQIQRFIRIEVSKAAAREGMETFEEANDFDVQDSDGEMPLSPFEKASQMAEDGALDASEVEEAANEVRAARAAPKGATQAPGASPPGSTTPAASPGPATGPESHSTKT